MAGQIATLNLSIAFPWWTQPMIKVAAFAVRLGIPVPLKAMADLVAKAARIEAY